MNRPSRPDFIGADGKIHLAKRQIIFSDEKENKFLNNR